MRSMPSIAGQPSWLVFATAADAGRMAAQSKRVMRSRRMGSGLGNGSRLPSASPPNGFSACSTVDIARSAVLGDDDAKPEVELLALEDVRVAPRPRPAAQVGAQRV